MHGTTIKKILFILYYFQFKTRPLSGFSELKIWALLKVEVLFFTPQKHNFPRISNSITKRVVNLTGSEMYLFEKLFFLETPLEEWSAS